MPLVKLHASTPENANALCGIMKELSKEVADGFGKSEDYLMAVFEPSAVLMGGTEGEAAFVDIRGIGKIDKATNNGITKRVCALLHERMGIPSERVYVTFTDIAPSNWGWNNNTF